MEYQDIPTHRNNWTTMQTSIIPTITLSGIILTTTQTSAIRTTMNTGTVVKKTKKTNKQNGRRRVQFRLRLFLKNQTTSSIKGRKFSRLFSTFIKSIKNADTFTPSNAENEIQLCTSSPIDGYKRKQCFTK